MKPLLFLANVFINTTQPSEESANRAARFIALLLGLVILMIVIAAVLALYFVARH
jgi:hypothetical protein